MNKSLVFIVILFSCFVFSVHADDDDDDLPDLKFIGNTSLANSREYLWRKLEVEVENKPDEISLKYKSTAYSGWAHHDDDDDDDDDFILDGIEGAAFVEPNKTAPSTILAYYSNWTEADDDDDDDNNGNPKINVTSAAGFIAASYLSLSERDENNTLVNNNTYPFRTLNWRLQSYNKSNEIHILTITATLPRTTCTVSLTFVVSAVLGVLSVADTIVTPKSLEVFVQINNYPYENDTNHLSMKVLIGSINYTLDQDDRFVHYKCPRGNSSVYFSLSKSVLSDGSQNPTTVSRFTPGSVKDFLNEFIEDELENFFHKDNDYPMTVSAVEIHFPRNASKILYDPSVGAGTPPQSSSDGAFAIWLIVVIVVACVLAVVVLVVIIVTVSKRNTDYSRI